MLLLFAAVKGHRHFQTPPAGAAAGTTERKNPIGLTTMGYVKLMALKLLSLRIISSPLGLVLIWFMSINVCTCMCLCVCVCAHSTLQIF